MIISDVCGLTKGSEKRVKVKCDSCGIESETTYSNYFHSQERRGWPNTTFCRPCVCRLSATKRIGKPAHNKGKKLDASQKGKNHPRWKGGRYISSDGYIMVHIGGDKKEVGWTSYRKEHTLIAEKFLKRALGKEEVVHHIDGVKTNNDSKNLWVTSSIAHRQAHNSLQEIGFCLFKQGLIGFNRKTGQYFWKDKLCMM